MPIPTFESYRAKLTVSNSARKKREIHSKIQSATGPLVSIVTVVKNGKTTLEPTIRSVLNQNYDNLEFIIIDGVSTDGTVELIERYSDQITHWISEPDNGIADAWNKGVALSGGDIVTILNAGDYFDPNCVKKVVERIDPQRAMMTYGSTVIVNENGSILRKVQGTFNPRNLAMGFGFLHPGCFATRKAYEIAGLFNTKFRLAMDCDWLFRCYRLGIPFRKLENICYMVDGGASVQANYSAYGEYLQAMKDNGFSHLQVRGAIAYYGLYLFISSLGGRLFKAKSSA